MEVRAIHVAIDGIENQSLAEDWLTSSTKLHAKAHPLEASLGKGPQIMIKTPALFLF